MSSVKKSFFRQAKSDFILVFAIFTFFGFGVGGFVEWLFLSNDATLFFSFSIAISCGLIAALGMIVLNYYDWPSVHADLVAGECVEIEAHVDRAISVHFLGSSVPAVALDCGNHTLVLIGNWWVNNLRFELWGNPKTQMIFPSNRFTLRYLPGSRRVLSVEVTGKKLLIQEPDPIESLLELRFPKNAEVEYVDQAMDTLITVSGIRG